MDEAGALVPPGEPGELIVKSAYLAEGYWNHPQETAAVFEVPPDVAGRRVYKTGDLARLLPDGRLVFLGRRDDQVKIRGYRVDTREVEAALLSLDAVKEAVVLPETVSGERRLLAPVVPNADYPRRSRVSGSL